MTPVQSALFRADLPAIGTAISCGRGMGRLAESVHNAIDLAEYRTGACPHTYRCVVQRPGGDNQWAGCEGIEPEDD